MSCDRCGNKSHIPRHPTDFCGVCRSNFADRESKADRHEEITNVLNKILSCLERIEDKLKD